MSLKFLIVMILKVIVFVALSAPLIAAGVLLFEKILQPKADCNILKKIIQKLLLSICLILAILLNIMLFYRYILNSFLPQPFHTIGVILFFIYYTVILTVFGGLGIAGGHSGISPTKILNSVCNIFVKRKKNGDKAE